MNKLLVIDIGNTNIVVAMFEASQDGFKLEHSSRVKTHGVDVLSDFNAIVSNLYYDNAVLCSVVPSLNDDIVKLIKSPVLKISSKINTGLVQSSIPAEIGDDILCNLIAAHHFYPNDYVTVADFGTAFTTATVSPEGKVMGATIAPGLWTSIKALFNNTAQIPQIELQIPKTVLGTDTVSSVRAGVVYGFKGQLEAIVSQIEKELQHSVKLVVTGGLSVYMAGIVPRIDRADINWTLSGACVVFELNGMLK